VSQSLSIRGHVQWLHLYGARGGQPMIVSSGDGGWIHLGPHVAETLAAGGRAQPILVGVSEGAGLSVLAATDPATRSAIGGVIGLGLPDINELGWR
jgi:hypothetical protein